MGRERVRAIARHRLRALCVAFGTSLILDVFLRAVPAGAKRSELEAVLLDAAGVTSMKDHCYEYNIRRGVCARVLYLAV